MPAIASFRTASSLLLAGPQGTDYFGLSLFFHAVFASPTIFELENMQVKNAPEEPFCIISA